MRRFPDHPERRPVVVAGASSGIGAAAASALAARGLPVALGARRTQQCEEIAERIRVAGGEAVVHALDVTDDESIETFAEAVRRDLGEVEAVVVSAALVQPGGIVETSTADFGRELDLNVLGAHRLIRAFAPGMLERRRGDLLFVSSDVALRARPFMRAYTASKWGAEGMVHALQMELEGSGVRASIVRPGPTQTGMGTDWDGEGVMRVIGAWERFGHARHDHFMRASAVGEAIADVITAPRGVHFNVVEVNPEAPIGQEDA